MPNDLYKWEDGGGLKHHCPKCFDPLTKPEAATTCVGKHVEPCKGYHHQLFMMGGSEVCDPCNRREDQQHERSKVIAKLLLQLQTMKADDRTCVQRSPLTPSTNTTGNSHRTPGEGPRVNGKQRRVAKQAKKRAERPRVEVTEAEVQRVTQVLHPKKVEPGEEDLEIALNLPFHPGTSNKREVRNEFVKKEKLTGKEEVQIDSKQIQALLEVLGASPPKGASNAAEAEIHAELKVLIKKDLSQAKTEDDQLAMRKAGFWRWAGKKAHRRLIAYRKARAAKNGPLTDDEITASISNGTPYLDADNITEPDSEVATPLEQDEAVELDVAQLTRSVLALKTKTKTPETPQANDSNRKTAEQGGAWTTVAFSNKTKQKAKKPVSGKLTLVHNGGLAKIASPVAPGNRYGDFVYADEDL